MQCGMLYHDMKKEDVSECLIKAVQSSVLSGSPFCHRVMERLFEDGVYQKMQALMPPNEAYHELRHQDALQPDGTSARLEFCFSERELVQLSPEQKEFWEAIGGALRSPELMQTFREALRPGLERRFKERWCEVEVDPKPRLIRDLCGYRIGIHPDIPEKVMTVQFYLPQDDSQRHLGTSFYRREAGRGFTKVKQMNFLPNTGYAFAVGDNSWHGVDQVSGADGIRNSLMIIYYLKR